MNNNLKGGKKERKGKDKSVCVGEGGGGGLGASSTYDLIIQHHSEVLCRDCDPAIMLFDGEFQVAGCMTDCTRARASWLSNRERESSVHPR